MPPPRNDNGSGGLARAGHSVVGNAGVTLIGSALGGVFVFANEALVARYLGVSTYGMYAIAFMLAKVAEIVAAFGLPITLVRFLPVQLSQGANNQALGTIIGAILLPIGISVFIAATLWAMSNWLAILVFGEPGIVPYLRNLALAIPFLVLSELLGYIARAFGRSLPYILIRNIAPPFIYLLFLVILTHSGGAPIEVTYGLLGAYLSGTILGSIIVGRLCWKIVGPVKPAFDLKSLYSYALPILLNAVMALVIIWTDLFLLGVFSTVATVGVYRACMQIVIVFDIVWTACSSAVAPIYPVLIHEKRQDQLRDTYRGAVHLATMLAAPLFLLILFNGADILGVLGPRFTAGAIPLAILAFAHFVKLCFGAASVLLVVGGKQRLEAANNTIAALLNVVLNLLLVPRLGLLGASIATCTTLLVLSGLRAVQLKRVFDLRTLDQAVYRIVFVTGLTALTFHVLASFCGFSLGSGIGIFLIRFALMGLSIAAALWIFCLDQAERQMLLGLLQRPRSAPASEPEPAENGLAPAPAASR